MLEAKIQEDMKQSLKEKDAFKTSTLRFLWAEIKNVRIDKRATQLDDQAVIAIIKRQIKQRNDSIEQFEKAGREDLKTKEAGELAILKGYLPQELTAGELEKLVIDAIKETGAASIKEMGKVIKLVLEKSAGRADNRQISELVKQKLS